MAKKPKPKTDAPLARRARDTGARLDLLLSRDWPNADAPLAWRLRPRIGDVETGKGTIDELPRAGSVPVYVWTPATETLLTQAVLPTTSRAKLAQALPYALEEQLLDDPTNLHFAWRREDDGALSVTVTGKERIRSWLTGLQRAGLTPTALCPATLLVPWSPGCWSAAFVDDELVVRTGPVSGFTTPATTDEPPSLLATSLKDAQQGARAPEYVIVFQSPGAFRADAWSTALGVPVRLEAGNLWNTPGDSTPALNLLQGDFAAKSEIGQQFRPLLPAAVMLGIWLAGTIAFDAVEWWRLNQRYSDTTREMAALLQSAFPEIRNPDFEPMKQMQNNLDRLQARGGMRPGDLLPLLARATPAWRGESRARLRGLRYTERSLTLELTTPDSQSLEKFRQTLQTAGLQAETLGTTTRAGEVEARLRLRSPATVSSARP